ncbi:Cyanate hydratase [Trichinella pseudospiralis]
MVLFRLFHFSRAKLLCNWNSSRSVSSICTVEDKQNLVKRLLEAKLDSGLTFDEIASRCEITNVHCAQLFHNQARLSPKLATTLKSVAVARSGRVQISRTGRTRSLAKVENDALSFEWTANFCPVLNHPGWISAKYVIFSIRFY